MPDKQPHQSKKKKKENYKDIDSKEFERTSKVLPIKEIELPKRQPRRSFNEERMEQLAESIQKFGILEPLIVRRLDPGKYELVAGERRYKVAQSLRLTEVPTTIIYNLNDQEALELALLENMQRADLNPIDETEGMLELLCKTLHFSQQEVVQLLNRAANAQKRNKPLTDDVTRQISIVDNLFLRVGRLNRESFRTNRLPLLNLPEDLLNVLRQGKLHYTKAKAIAKLNDKNRRNQIVQQAIDENLSLKTIKERISFPTDVLNVVEQGTLQHEKAKAIAKLKNESQRQQIIRETIDEGLSLKSLKERINTLLKPQKSAQASEDISARLNSAIESHDLQTPTAGQNNADTLITTRNLQSELQELSQIHSDAWNDEAKNKKIAKILTELRIVLGS